MQKIKYLIASALAFLGLALFASPAYAIPTVVSIQQLPGFINYTDFKLSCTTNGSTAQFYSTKDGGSYTAFGPAIDLTTSPCSVQVTGFQFGSEGKFDFEVIVNGSISDQTSTTLDTTAPGAPTDFGKARSNSNTTYTITWKNPLDSDFVKTFIYRGTTAGFEADDGHKVATIGGNPGDSQSWNDGGLDPNQEYFYYVRAIDHANNGSSLVGDSSTTTVSTTPSPRAGGAVTVLPKEQGTGGSVLGTEASPTPEASLTPAGGMVGQINQYAAQTPEPFKWILTHKKISLGILIILGLIAYNFFVFSKRK